MQREISFWVLLPLIYAIIAYTFDAMLFNPWAMDPSIFQVLHMNVFGSIVDLFQCIVLLSTIVCSYVLATSSMMQRYNFFYKYPFAFSIIGLMVGVFLTLNLWILALPLAILSACMTGIKAYILRNHSKEKNEIS